MHHRGMAMSPIATVIPYPDGTRFLDRPDQLRAFAQTEGAMVLRQVCDRESLAHLREQLLVRAKPWLSHDDVAKKGSVIYENGSDPIWQTWYDQVQHLRTFHAFAHQPPLLKIMSDLLGGEVLVHPRSIARAVGPGTARFTTPPHQDHWYIGGTRGVWTAWIPLGDCPLEMGGIAVLPRSHHNGVLPREGAEGAGGHRVAGSLPAQWAWSPLHAGDVLLFHSLTVHQAREHCSPKVRLSLDVRYQRVDEPVAADSLQPHGGRLAWPEIYQDWAGDDPLRDYWRHLPLDVVP